MIQRSFTGVKFFPPALSTSCLSSGPLNRSDAWLITVALPAQQRCAQKISANVLKKPQSLTQPPSVQCWLHRLGWFNWIMLWHTVELEPFSVPSTIWTKFKSWSLIDSQRNLQWQRLQCLPKIYSIQRVEREDLNSKVKISSSICQKQLTITCLQFQFNKFVLRAT